MKKKARLHRHAHIISSFHKFNKRQQKELIRHFDKDQTKFVCELCINLLSSYINLSPSQMKALVPYKKQIRHLAGRSSLKSKKKKMMNGGFIPSLLIALATALLPTVIDKIKG